MRHLIFAPHPDDELIGCFDLLNTLRMRESTKDTAHVVYCDVRGVRDEAAVKAVAKRLGFSYTLPGADLHNCVRSAVSAQLELVEQAEDVTQNLTIWAPDPRDTHPLHQAVHAAAKSAAWNFDWGGVQFGTYSTEMNVPYKVVLGEETSEAKRTALDVCYPTKSSLWQYEHKYFLFEARIIWNPAV